MKKNNKFRFLPYLPIFAEKKRKFHENVCENVKTIISTPIVTFKNAAFSI